MLDIGLSREAITRALYDTLAANGMTGDGVHIRLMVTRGVKRTPYQDPRVNVSGPTLVITAEHKKPVPEARERGLRLFTVHVRRGRPERSTRCAHSGPATVRAAVCTANTQVTSTSDSDRTRCSHSGKNCMNTPSTQNSAT